MEAKNRYEGFALFLKSNAALGGIYLTVLASGTDVRLFISVHERLVIAVTLIFEILLIVYISTLLIINNQKSHEEVSPDFLHRERNEIRFAKASDFTAIMKIYHEHFGDDVAINSDEYCKILSRKGYSRVSEVTICEGDEIITKIVGYYSIWILRLETYNMLTQGNLKEQDLRDGDVVDLDTKEQCVVYIPEICILHKWDVGPLLLRDMLRYIYLLISKNENICCVAAWPYTKYGKKLTKSFYMKPAKGRRFLQRIHVVERGIALSFAPPKGIFKDRFQVKY